MAWPIFLQGRRRRRPARYDDHYHDEPIPLQAIDVDPPPVRRAPARRTASPASRLGTIIIAIVAALALYALVVPNGSSLAAIGSLMTTPILILVGAGLLLFFFLFHRG